METEMTLDEAENILAANAVGQQVIPSDLLRAQLIVDKACDNENRMGKIDTTELDKSLDKIKNLQREFGIPYSEIENWIDRKVEQLNTAILGKNLINCDSEVEDKKFLEFIKYNFL